MQGIPFKFRGRSANGEYVYGDLLHIGGRTQIMDDFSITTVDSVAQLCGYDDSGNEIYEGDALDCYHFGRFNCTSTAKLDATAEVFYRDEFLNHNPDYQFRLKGGELSEERTD